MTHYTYLKVEIDECIEILNNLSSNSIILPEMIIQSIENVIEKLQSIINNPSYMFSKNETYKIENIVTQLVDKKNNISQFSEDQEITIENLMSICSSVIPALHIFMFMREI